MAGIYFHIPFCKQACHYCDFHFSTSLKRKDSLLDCMVGELQLRRAEIRREPIETIYFGGGTPSLLSSDEINRFFDEIAQLVDLSALQEVTMEANPDDLEKNYLHDLRATPINRLSIGVQSFFDKDLSWMNRAHNQQQALTCISNAQDFGYENITIDLIYGSPTTTDDMWAENINIWMKLNIPHLSAYCLTVEEQTALYHQIKTGQSKPVDEEKSLRQFSFLQSFCESNEIDQYEISNYARDGKIAIHNSNYWKGRAYIGIGPSAHSYDGHSIRRWTIKNNAKYIDAIQNNKQFWAEEQLHEVDQINEYLMTSLRTKWGVQKTIFNERFGRKNLIKLNSIIEQEMLKGRLVVYNESINISKEFIFQTDDIISSLFFDAD